jgi:hypothetical protein
LTPRLTLTFLIILALPVLTVPFLYIAHDIVSPGHRLAFTELMKYGGLSCLPLGFAVLVSLVKSGRARHESSPEQRYLGSSLLASLGLFAVGGVLGFLISGLDIVIPAHYHGSTVGVTIAFMGISYYLLPRLGFGPLPPRMCAEKNGRAGAGPGSFWRSGRHGPDGPGRPDLGYRRPAVSGRVLQIHSRQELNMSELILFSLNAIVIYLVSDWLVRLIENWPVFNY